MYMGECLFYCIWIGCEKKFVCLDEFVWYYCMYMGEKCYVCGICSKCFMRSDYFLKYVKMYGLKFCKELVRFMNLMFF